MSESIEELYESVQDLSQEELSELYGRLYSDRGREYGFYRQNQAYPVFQPMHSGPITIPIPRPPPRPPRPDPGPPDLPPLPPWPDPWPPDEYPPVTIEQTGSRDVQQRVNQPVISVLIRSGRREDSDDETLTGGNITINTTDDSENMSHARSTTERAVEIARELVNELVEAHGDGDPNLDSCTCEINISKQ